MEKMANKLSVKIAAELKLEDEKRQVIQYGLTALFQTIVVFVIVLAFGVLLRCVVEAIISLLSVSILRKYSGGAHASSMKACNIVSVILCSSFALLSKNVMAVYITPVWAMLCSISIFAVASYIIYLWVPVDTPNKPITSEKKIERMRKYSFGILIAYFWILLVLVIWGRENSRAIGYASSLLLGLSWQVFSLTPIGIKFLKRLDQLLNKFPLIHS